MQRLGVQRCAEAGGAEMCRDRACRGQACRDVQRPGAQRPGVQERESVGWGGAASVRPARERREGAHRPCCLWALVQCPLGMRRRLGSASGVDQGGGRNSGRGGTRPWLSRRGAGGGEPRAGLCLRVCPQAHSACVHRHRPPHKGPSGAPLLPQPPAAPAPPPHPSWLWPRAGLGPLRQLAAPLGPPAGPAPQCPWYPDLGRLPFCHLEPKRRPKDSVLPCKVGQRPRLEGPRWSRHTHTPHPCRHGPEPRGQGPSTPHRRQGQQEGREDTARGSGAQCLAGSTRLRTRVTAKDSLLALGRAVGLWATRGQGPQPGLGDRGEGGFGMGSAEVTHAHQAHTTHTHAHQTHTRGGSTGPWLQQPSQQQGKRSRPEGLVSEALTFASVSGSFFHF